MSMPDFTLVEIDPRLALASVVASIALQEAAVSHVLNAEGEKIQAVAGLTGTTVGDLQSVDLSVGGTMDSVALLEDVLQNKLQTALQALFPAAAFTIQFADIVTGLPVDCQCIQSILTNLGTSETTSLVAHGASITLAGLRPGSYTLEMLDPCEGYALNDSVFNIAVNAQGNATFNGVPVSVAPPVIELAEDPIGRAAPIAEEEPVAEEATIAEQEEMPAQYRVMRLSLPGLQ